jgi:hypothetical protein
VQHSKILLPMSASVRVGPRGGLRCRSALPPKADIDPRSCDVAQVPQAAVSNRTKQAPLLDQLVGRLCMYYCGHKRVSHWPKRSSKRVGGRSGGPQALPIPSALERLKPFIRSTRSSLNRTFGGIWSTGFTRATSICGKLVLVPLVVGIVADPCAYAATDHAAATPPNRPMNSRRLIRSPRRRAAASH